MATNTYQSYLMYKPTGSSTTLTKLLDIKDYPDLGSAPETLETTTLSDSAQTYIEGIQSVSQLTFTSNYDKTTYNTIKGLKGKETEWAVYFGAGTNNTPDGKDGKFGSKGYFDVYVNGKGVNEVREMTVTVTPSTPIAELT